MFSHSRHDRNNILHRYRIMQLSSAFEAGELNGRLPYRDFIRLKA